MSRPVYTNTMYFEFGAMQAAIRATTINQLLDEGLVVLGNISDGGRITLEEAQPSGREVLGREKEGPWHQLDGYKAYSKLDFEREFGAPAFLPASGNSS